MSRQLPEVAYGIEGVARACERTCACVRWHLYVAKDLAPDGHAGRTMIFTRATMEAFLANIRPPGRPVTKQKGSVYKQKAPR